MYPQYKHTQIGYLTLGGLALATVLILVATLAGGKNSVTIIALFVVGIAAILFSSLTVEIRDGALRWYFGQGVLRKQVRLEEIEHVERVKNPWLYGWGIRLTPHGWLYNVSGTDAIQVRLKGSKQFRLGTDRPDELLHALQDAVGIPRTY